MTIFTCIGYVSSNGCQSQVEVVVACKYNSLPFVHCSVKDPLEFSGEEFSIFIPHLFFHTCLSFFLSFYLLSSFSCIPLALLSFLCHSPYVLFVIFFSLYLLSSIFLYSFPVPFIFLSYHHSSPHSLLSFIPFLLPSKTWQYRRTTMNNANRVTGCIILTFSMRSVLI